MYVVKRKGLMELLEKQDAVVYGMVYENYINGIYVAEPFTKSDFCTTCLHENVDLNDVPYYGEWLKNGTHFKFDLEAGGREGLFDEDKMYAIYEKSDVEALIDKLQGVLDNYGG